MKKAFTRIELLVAIAIIVVLLTIIIPTMPGGGKKQAKAVHF